MFKLKQKCLNIRQCTSGFNLKNKNIFNIVLLMVYLWRIYVKTTGGFINIPVEHFHKVKTAPNNITNCTNIDVGRDSSI